MLRTLLIGVLALGMAIQFSAPSAASVVLGDLSITDVPPANDPGWFSVSVGGNVTPNFIYLGDGWALSARHVGPAAGSGSQTLHFSSGPLDIIPGQNYVIRNPAQVENSSGEMIDLATATGGLETDLRLVRLNGDPGLPSITIAEESPPLGGDVRFIGHGRTRAGNSTEWNASWQEVPPNMGPVAFTGYKSMNPSDDVKRWGDNNIANVNSYHDEDAFYEIISSTTGALELETADGKIRNVISLAASFDAGSQTYEVQAVDKDSGSAVFYERSGQWELSGIVNSQFVLEGQPGTSGCGNLGTRCAVFGNVTTFADLSFYYHSDPADDHPFSISDIMRNNPNYSMLGDVNLNGAVSGDGTGPVATDDVSAFIAGWGYNSGVANITAWKNGDLSGPTGVRDGRTDVYDFLALRNAINGPISGAALARLGLAVPEPSAAAISIVAASYLFAAMRRRRAPSVR